MSQFVSDRAYDYFDLGDESEQESAESSEDEIDIILHGTPEQRRRLRHVHEKEQEKKMAVRQSKQLVSKSRPQQHGDGQQSSSEDEFEKEMNAELEKTVSMLEKSRSVKRAQEVPSASSSTSTTKRTKQGSSSRSAKHKDPFYDDIYFDSDDEDNYEGMGDARVQRHHSKPSNDDLLYDPDMDDDDQKWVDEQRCKQHGENSQTVGSKRKNGKKNAVPKSDAVLDCPACMTTLCIDCQRHDIYPNQYRAMFVMNCKINTSELLSVPEQAAKKKLKKSKSSKTDAMESNKSSEDPSSASKDQFHPVLCEECGTVVGVVDVDEVYHFFNVLPSQP